LGCTIGPTYNDIVTLCPVEASRLTKHLAGVQQIGY
jgi:hypothetical protein